LTGREFGPGQRGLVPLVDLLAVADAAVGEDLLRDVAGGVRALLPDQLHAGVGDPGDRLERDGWRRPGDGLGSARPAGLADQHERAGTEQRDEHGGDGDEALAEDGPLLEDAG